MSDWPKTAHDIWGAWEGVGEDDEELPADFKVVPADLARDLYEALLEAQDNTPYCGGVNDAIARYEREVGK